MNNNNHNHQPCGSGETLVAYLYGEASAAESEKFKAHLVECAECSAELAGFGVVRSSIVEWRQEEFAPMSAPAIEMPVRSDAVILTDEPPSWLTGLRAFFTPRMTLAAAGFAALVICAALTVAVLNSQKAADDNILAKNSSPENNKPQITNSGTNETAPGEDTKKNSAAVKQTEDKAATSAKPRPQENTTVIKISNTAPKQKNAPKVKPQKPENLPGIYEETQDDTLRLADLFTETDTEDMH